jgi:hypothetical protein
VEVTESADGMDRRPSFFCLHLVISLHQYKINNI